MSKDIRLDPKFGLNPSVSICNICGKDDGIILFGRMKGGIEAPREIHAGPCEACMKEMTEHGKKGYLIIILHDDYDPHNTEHTKEALRFITGYSVLKPDSKIAKQIRANHPGDKETAMMAHSTAKQLGLLPEE
jgi:hypothetical protein